MTNHFHLVFEDTGGVLSQFMHRVLSTYAGYFNRSRPAGRCGPLFQERFHSEVLDSEAYFRAACAYTVLNPLRCQVPLAESPEAYLWSSAAFAVAPSDVSSSEFCSRLLEGCGGLEGYLEQLPGARRKSSSERQRRRAEALVSGKWLDRSRLLAGRSPNEYRQALLSARGLPKPNSKNTSQDGEWHGFERSAFDKPIQTVERTPFQGADVRRSLEAARELCGGLFPKLAEFEMASECETAGIVPYVVWRFTTCSMGKLADALGISPDMAQVVVERFREVRVLEPGWRDLLWRIEWALRWRLLSGPCRV